MTFSFLHVAMALQRAITTAMAERDDRAQSMAEYALLMLGVGLLAVFVFKWLQGSGLIESLFSGVISKILPG
jgi:hypothetical protein